MKREIEFTTAVCLAVALVIGVATVVKQCVPEEDEPVSRENTQQSTKQVIVEHRSFKLGKDITNGVKQTATEVDSESRVFMQSDARIVPQSERLQLASDKNQVMDELLNQSQVPADYGETMIALYRDKSQDVLTRDFAVQHIGLYAQALSRRGKYVPESEDARNCRAALFDAASETHTIVAAAAFRALADMLEFDSRVDTRRLDSLLASCVADASATPASRAMAVQLCGERRIAASRPALEKAAADPAASEVVRRSAKYALSLIDAR